MDHAAFRAISYASKENESMSVLKQKILDRTVTLGVVGLGYVGLPLAVE